MSATSEQRKLTIDTEHFTILNTTPPFVDICLKFTAINAVEFLKIAQLAASYQNDARLIEMVRIGGDASAKVPYLMDASETPTSILATLREVAEPQMERFHSLPDPLQSTICLLLSINTVPRGCEAYAIAALLEIDRMQEEMTQRLRDLMRGRILAQDFHRNNMTFLKELDQDWPRLRSAKSSQWHSQPLPEQPHMQYSPLFDNKNRLVNVSETCVIVDTPGAHVLKRFTPPVLQRPLPTTEPAPTTKSVDWLIRDAGKIGRHFTRALLEIIKTHLKDEQVALEAGNLDLINRRAQEALHEFVKKTP